MNTVSQTLLNDLSGQAKESERKRAFHRLHEHEDPVLKLLIALEPDTYLPPHKHSEKDREEVFVGLRGKVMVIFFDNEGKITEKVLIGPQEETLIVEIPIDAWHTTVSLAEGSIILEVVKGPYNAQTHKLNAPWAPQESDRSVANEYLDALKSQL